MDADGCLCCSAQFGTCGDDDDDDDDQHHLQGPEPHSTLQQQQLELQQQRDSDDSTIGTQSLPAVAARVAAFCPGLAPGTDARELLNSMPILAQAAGLTVSTVAGDISAMPAAPAGAVVNSRGAAEADRFASSVDTAFSGEAVARLLTLGRQANRAATEAMAADAAVQAVHQVRERLRARDAV